MNTHLMPHVVAAIRTAATHPLPEEISPRHSFVTDLGFDSMGIVCLGVALEDELGRPILLDGWVSSCADPHSLTVSSLCAYLGALPTHEPAPVLG